jgi:hypothetical protein
MAAIPARARASNLSIQSDHVGNRPVISVSDSEIRLDEAAIPELTTTLGKDGVHHFTNNRSRLVPGGIPHGFLTLAL